MACPITVQVGADSGTTHGFLLNILSASLWLGWDLIKRQDLCFYPLDTGLQEHGVVNQI